MKLLIIGLGSMGKRRIRCLKTLGYKYIWGYDESPETAQAVYKEYEIDVCFRKRDLKNWVGEFKYDAIFICVPPTVKEYYVELANDNGIPCFCEADIQSYDGDYYPSRTMIYHPAIRKIRDILTSGDIGTVYAFTYHLGQHIRDWHEGADYSKYYAAKKETGACREMFCFELAWLSWIFGQPIDAKGFVSKQLLDEEIAADDVYSTVIKFQCPKDGGWWRQLIHPSAYSETITGTVLIDVVSRPATRELMIVGGGGILKWNWGGDFIDVITKDGSRKEKFDRGKAAKGYNQNIPEQMYVDEVKAFLHDVICRNSDHTCNVEHDYSLEEERKIIELLWKVEEQATKL